MSLLTKAHERFRSTEALWKNKSFMHLFSAQVMVSLGTSVSQMALPLTAVSVLGAGPGQMGLLAAFQLAPYVLFSLPAGVWIDRSSKKRLAVLFDLFAALGLALVPLSAAFGFLSMPILYLVGAMVATTEAIGGSAVQVFVTRIVGVDRLVEANGSLSSASSAMMIAGPPLAAGLVAAFGAPFAVTANTLSFLGSAFFVSRIPYREKIAPHRGLSLLEQIKEGLILVKDTPMLKSLVLVVFLWISLNESFKALYILHAAVSLGFGPGNIAFINTLGAVGGLTGAVSSPFLRRLFFRKQELSGPHNVGNRAEPGGKAALDVRFMRGGLAWGIMLAGAGTLVFASVPKIQPELAGLIAGPALFLVDFGASLYTVNYLSLRLAVTPNELMGRMVTAMRFLSILFTPLATVSFGSAAESLGLYAVLYLLAGVTLLTGLGALRLLPKSA